MLVRRLIETLKSTKYPDAYVYLHDGINKEAATGVIFKNNVVVLQSGRDDHKLKTSCLLDLLKEANPETRVYFEDGGEILVVNVNVSDRVSIKGEADTNATCKLDPLFRFTTSDSPDRQFYLNIWEDALFRNTEKFTRNLKSVIIII